VDGRACLPQTVCMRFGHYEVKGEIARGGMGVVYRAHDPRLKRDVAIKVLLGQLSPPRLLRFEREARVLAQLQHPNVLRVYDGGVSPRNEPYLVLEIVEGESLQQRLDRDDSLAPHRAAEIARDLARGLAHCHERGILHRDLKPGNVLLEQGTQRALLADFGLARDPEAEREHLTRTGQMMGTPRFMPPEQLSARPLDERADVYSLGATLFATLTGAPPFDAPTMPELLANVATQPVPRASQVKPGVPRDLDSVCGRSLAKEPEDRYPTAAALADDLERWLAGARVEAHRDGGLRQVAVMARRRPGASLGLVVAVLAVALLVALFTTPPPPPAAEPSPPPAARPLPAVGAPPARPRLPWVWALRGGEQARYRLIRELETVDERENVTRIEWFLVVRGPQESPDEEGVVPLPGRIEALRVRGVHEGEPWVVGDSSYPNAGGVGPILAQMVGATFEARAELASGRVGGVYGLSAPGFLSGDEPLARAEAFVDSELSGAALARQLNSVTWLLPSAGDEADEAWEREQIVWLAVDLGLQCGCRFYRDGPDRVLIRSETVRPVSRRFPQPELTFTEFQLTGEAGFDERGLAFSRLELRYRLGMPNGGPPMDERLRYDLKRLD
jgi:predicted Ser/Thr protein kinase